MTQFTWTSHSRTDPGLVRDHNEDAFVSRPEIGLFAVADGMGGHSAGEVASRAIVQRLSGVDSPDTLSAFVTAVEAGILEVNAQLRDLGQRPIRRTIGSTVVVLLLKHRHGVTLWAGDSRLYRYRDARLEQVSQDHAFVEDLVEHGYIDRDEAALHPQANLVTRAVGAMDDLKLDAEIVELRHDDFFLLCSDGLDKEVSAQEIVALIERHHAERDHAAVCDALIDLALERGARDNITVTTVHVSQSKGDD